MAYAPLGAMGISKYESEGWHLKSLTISQDNRTTDLAVIHDRSDVLGQVEVTHLKQQGITDDGLTAGPVDLHMQTCSDADRHIHTHPLPTCTHPQMCMQVWACAHTCTHTHISTCFPCNMEDFPDRENTFPWNTNTPALSQSWKRAPKLH